MAIRILWSLEEAVIMLDFLLKNINGEIDRKEAISAVSKELRERAMRNGIEIDDIFRNTNGITFQMSSMENILTDGKRGLAKPAKVFYEAVELYRNDNLAYLQLLKEARKMPESKSVQDRFFEWMEKQVSPSRLADMFLVVQDIESFCIDRKILRKKLFETTDLPTIRQVHNTVTSNKIFRRIYKNKLSKMESLILQYHRFLRAEAKKEEKQKMPLIPEVSSNTSENAPVRVAEAHSSTETTIESKESIKPLNQQIEREKFNLWMQKSGLSNSATRCYISALNSFSVYLSNKAGKRISVYEESAQSLQTLRDSISSDAEMKNLNLQYHSHISAGLNKLISYRSGEVIVTASPKKTVKDEITQTESIPKIDLPDFSKTGNNSVDPELEQFDKILRDNFAEGLLPNALRLDKFRMFFEDEFGYEPTADDDLLIQQLKKVGNFMDDRIYPKQDAKQSNLIADILTEIINTLNYGAKCIYFSCVIERWRTELANELNIYNEETLKALLAAQNVSGLILTDYVLKATKQKVYPEENVVEVMRECHSFMNYEQLANRLWFIPIDTIKHTLVTTPSIVNVDAETYFYASNFPASTAELQQIKELMVKKLDEKGYLVAPDIYSIIQSCHTVAINTEGYKDWAYRNVFKYIFREDFEFGSSVISKKGNALEMWQVYRGYCQEHERITLDDLKQLKDELGVTIYWDTVMDEMIRINSEELIRKDLIHFDVDAVDTVLEEMCPGDYLPLKDITLFLHFPSVEYPWNSFMLESYLSISKKFCLFHASYANHGAFGVMVRRDSKFADYKSVVVDMLSRSDEWQTTKQALALIVDKGYQARKKWAGFEKVTQEASLIREKLLEGK